MKLNKIQGKQSWLLLCANTLLILGAAYCVASLLLSTSDQWDQHAFPLLGKNIRMLPPFADIRAITAVAGCSADINQIIEKSSVGCDPYGRTGGLGYPPFVYLIARAVGIDGGWTNFLALIIGLVYICTIATISTGSNLKKTIGGILLLSVPSQLGLERLNIDLIIFSGLALIAILRERSNIPKTKEIIISAAVAFVCTAAKLYFILGICIWLSTARLAGDLKRKFDTSVCLAAIAGLLTALPWLNSGDSFATPNQGLFSHGLIFRSTNGTILGTQTIVSIGFLLAGAYAASSKSGLRNLIRNYHKNMGEIEWKKYRFSFSIACSGLATWAGCYIATGNWDYRLIFIFPWILMASDIISDELKYHRIYTGISLVTCILCAALIQVISPYAYIWTAGITGETMSAKDWILNPFGMLLRHIASTVINLSDLAILPFFTGGSLIICWFIYAERQQHKKLLSVVEYKR